MINDIPIVMPNWDDVPWALAFSTVSYDDGKTYDYKKDCCEESRIELNKSVGFNSAEWLTLEHGNRVLTIPPDDANSCLADAAIVVSSGNAAAITTADCLPVVILSPSSKIIAVAHAGWKGIVNGVVENTVKKMSEYLEIAEQDFATPAFRKDDLRVWIGPSVRDDYEIREDVKNPLLSDPNISDSFFSPIGNGQFVADLPAILIRKLEVIGIKHNQIDVYKESTISSKRFFSVRREGANTGRLATLVGIK